MPVQELLRGVEFSAGLDLCLNAMKKLELYTSTTCKNGVDICNSLKQDWLLTFSPPELNENHDHTAGDVENPCKQRLRKRSY